MILEVLQSPLMQRAFIVGILAGIACGVIGSFVVVRRLTFISGAIAHSVLGGVGAAVYLGIRPIYGVLITSQIAALVIGWISRKAREKEDALIAAVWAVGMAAGILLAAHTPGYSADLMSYLFGNILLISIADIWWVGVLDIVILIVVVFLYKELVATCFDEEYAEIRNVATTTIYLILLCLIAVTIVILMRVVGLIMLIALLALPATIAMRYTAHMVYMMIIASVIGVACTVIGLFVAYICDCPAGAMIVFVTALAFMLDYGVHSVIRVINAKKNST